MNSLSWMIYAADAVGSLKSTCVLLSIFGGVGLAVATGILLCEDEYEGRAASVANRLWATFGAALLLACLLPSQTTIYAIAASEMGEKALNTQTGGKAVQALNAWLDRQIKGDSDKND